MKRISTCILVVLTVLSLHAQNSTTLKTYNNYDFVPGDKILFEDNFADDQDGEFPAKWNLESGQGVLNKLNDELCFSLTEGNFVKVSPRLKTKSYLTDPFTVELDYFVQAEARNGIRLFFECADETERLIEFNESGDVASGYFPEDLNATYPGDKDNFAGQWHHVSVVFKKGQIKCYLDQYRVLVMPNTEIVPVSIQIGEIGDTGNPVIFKNARLAAGGGMNLVAKKFTDAKIVTHGINFDYNKATVRPESMGTLI